MPRDKTEWAWSGKLGVDAPGRCPVAYNRSAATSTLCLDGGDDPWRQSRPLPARRCGEEGRGTSWRRRRASSTQPKRIARRRLRGTRIARLTRSAGGRTRWATAQPRARSLTATPPMGMTTGTTARRLTEAGATSPGTAGRRANSAHICSIDVAFNVLHILVFSGVRVLAKGIHCVRHKLLDGGLQ